MNLRSIWDIALFIPCSQYARKREFHIWKDLISYASNPDVICADPEMGNQWLISSALIRARLLPRVNRSHVQTVINPRRACAARVTVLMCVSVCLSVTTFSATARNNAPNKIYQRLQRDMSKVLKMAFSLTTLRSEVLASFAYRESHRRYYRDPELISSTAQGYEVVQKPNRALNATWNTGIQANAMQRYFILSNGQYILRFFPYTFQILKRGGVQRKTSYTHVLTRTSYCICV